MENKTVYFSSNNTREQVTMNKFLSDEKRKDVNVTSLAKSLKDISTRTFDNTLVKLNIPQSTSDELKVKRLDYFEKRLSREKEEIEGFRV
jgi:menaquinone-dependent protoporphyrinogen IX oxidase